MAHKVFPKLFLRQLMEMLPSIHTYKMSCDVYKMLSLKVQNLLTDRHLFGEQRIPAKPNLPLHNFQGI